MNFSQFFMPLLNKRGEMTDDAEPTTIKKVAGKKLGRGWKILFWAVVILAGAVIYWNLGKTYLMWLEYGFAHPESTISKVLIPVPPAIEKINMPVRGGGDVHWPLVLMWPICCIGVYVCCVILWLFFGAWWFFYGAWWLWGQFTVLWSFLFEGGLLKFLNLLPSA